MQINLQDCPLFADVEEGELESLLGCLGAVEKSYRKGELILREGETTEWIGIVLEGLVMVECSDLWGNNSVLGSAAPGAVFAEAYACVPGEALMISAKAAEDSRVLFINVGRMLSTCTNTCVFHAKLVRNLLTVCAQKNLQLSRRILHTGAKSIRGRLLSYFSQCIKKTGSYSFTVPYNRQQLADYLSVDRSALSAELSRMQREGLISYHRNSFTVKKELP